MPPRRLLLLFFIGMVSVLGSAPAQAMGSHRPPPPGSVAAHVQIINSPYAETCKASHFYSAPLGLTEQNGRLITPLRNAARSQNPIYDLYLSAQSYLYGDLTMSDAYADLSVTGKHAYSYFQGLSRIGLIKEEVVIDELRKNPVWAHSPESDLFHAAAHAINRAYRVANAIAYGNSPDRAALGWIAVSGEDDEPYRPVNVPSSPYRQYDLAVQVGTHLVHTRYTIAEGLHDPAPAPAYSGRTLPNVGKPSISSNAQVLIFIHGMDSSLEESLPLTKAFREISRDTDLDWTLISMDLPSAGYADKIDPFSISPITDIGTTQFWGIFNAHGRQNVPILDFMENFVVSFVNTLNKKIPIEGKIRAVIGGSLGGNLTFRLGRRKDIPWLKNVVAWSPASIWTGFADGADLLKHAAVATVWNRGGGDSSHLTETANARNEFFENAFNGAVNVGPIEVVPPQPEQWWRSSWPCFNNAVATSRMQRVEIYNRAFRLWHWRLAAEQLIYSQQKPPNLSSPRYLSNRIPMLLLAGSDDDFNYSDIYSTSLDVARKMVNTPGQAVFVNNTGHSIHDERPNFLAHEIVKFLMQRH